MSLMTSGNRRDFISAGIKLTAAGTLLGAGLSSRSAAAAACPPENLMQIDVSHYLLRNVRLEEAFVRHHDVITATRTGLYDIEGQRREYRGYPRGGFQQHSSRLGRGGSYFAACNARYAHPSR
jgi:hypothetical protein